MARALMVAIALLGTLAGCGTTREMVTKASRDCRDRNSDRAEALAACNLMLDRPQAEADRARYLTARGFAQTKTEHYAEGIADLTAALALIPIVLAACQPGNEIQAPMAAVILGGLTSSTILNLLVIPPLLAYFARPTVA